MWVRVAKPGPTKRNGHSLCRGEKGFFLFGGYNGQEQFGDVCFFSLESDQWYTCFTSGSGPLPKGAHAAAMVEEKMYIFGGSDGTSVFDETHCLDTESMQWTTLPRHDGGPSPRSNLCMAAVGTKLYMYGGMNMRTKEVFDDLYCFDTEDNTWALVPRHGTPPPPLSNFGMAAVGKRLYLFGGREPTRELSSALYEFDTERGTWIKKLDALGETPSARSHHTLTAADDDSQKLFLYGGFDGKIFRSDVHVLNLMENKWEKLRRLSPAPRGGHAAAYHSDQLFTFGGWISSGRNFRNQFFGSEWWGDTFSLLLSTELLKGASAKRAMKASKELAKYKGRECVICLENPPKVVFVACGHFVTCIDCATQLREAKGKPFCPICRSPIEEFVEVFTT